MKCRIPPPMTARAKVSTDPLSSKQLDALSAWTEDAINLGLFPELTRDLPRLIAEVRWFRAKAVERGKTS